MEWELARAAERDAEGPRRVLLAGLRAPERAMLGEALELTGHEVEAVPDGDAALAALRAQRPDLLVIDLELPGMPGHRVLRAIREEGIPTTVLVLSQHGGESDAVLGFRVGADAYVALPCGAFELQARVESLLRRRRTSGPVTSRLVVGDLEIDPAARTVRRGGRLVELRPRAFDLLLALARHRGSVLSRRELLREVWSMDDVDDTRTVDMHVAHLRQALGDDADNPRLLITVRKLGYRLAGED